MTSEPRPLDVMAEQITEAWDELLLARIDWSRSPNADTIRTEQYAELRLNRLLERLFSSMSDEQRQAVGARAVRYTVDVG